MRSIYVFSTPTYKQKKWFKVGQTLKKVQDRIHRQDISSCPEALEQLFEKEVPDIITDKKIHKLLRTMPDCYEVRKHREWFHLPNEIENVETAINQLIYGIPRPNSYKPRIEQLEGIQKASQYLLHPGVQEFLLNCKMRYGKTFVALHIAKALGARKILILTYKPQVMGEWKDCAETHTDFVGLGNFYYAKEFEKDSPFNPPEDCIVFTSFQDYNEIEKSKWTKIRNTKWDLVIIDEAHFGANTLRAKETQKHINCQKWLQLSGTPYTMLLKGNWLPEQVYTWSYIDEQRCRRAEEKSGWKTEIYRPLPVMKLHLIDLPEEVKKTTQFYSDDEQFSFIKFFESENDAPLDLFIDQLAGYQHKNMSPYLTSSSNHSLIMLNRVDGVKRLAGKLKKHSFFKNYHIIIAAGDEEKDIEAVKQAIKKYPKTITVSCGRFNTGVTIPEWNLVIMLRDGNAAETYFQTIFRSQSPDRAHSKEICNVYDYAPQRALEVLFAGAEAMAKPNQSTQEALREWYDYCPVLHHADNKIVTKSAEDNMQFVSEKCLYIQQFGSSMNVCLENLSPEGLQILEGIVSEKILKQKEVVVDNGLVKGKNFKTIKEKQAYKLKIKTEKSALKKMVTIINKLPKFLYLSEKKYDNIAEILKTTEVSDFTEIVGISPKELSAISTGFDLTRVNRRIMAFNSMVNNTDRKSVPNIMKALYGSSSEANTPMEIFSELYEKILGVPKYVLDPCCGKGTSLMVWYDRLMMMLEKSIPNEKARSKHIIKNMLFGIDIDPIQCRLARKNLSKYTGIDSNNIVCEDSLTLGKEGIQKRFMKPGFDVVTGNPPYQAVMESGQRKARSHSLWPEFIELGMNLLNPNGCLAYITPKISLRKTVVDVFHKNDVLFYNGETVKKYFPGIGSSFCSWVIRKTKTNCQSTVIVNGQEVQMTFPDDWSFIPTSFKPEDLKFIQKMTSKKNKLNFETKGVGYHSQRKELFSDIQTKIFKYPFKHAGKIRYCKKYHPVIGEKKVICSKMGLLRPEYDMGQFGITEDSTIMRVKSKVEGESIVKLLDGDNVRRFVSLIGDPTFISVPKILDILTYD